MSSPFPHSKIVPVLFLSCVLVYSSCTVSPAGRLEEARRLVAETRLGEAEEVLTDLLGHNPADTIVLSLYGEVLLERGDFRRADSVFRALARHSKRNPAGTLYAQARIALDMGQPMRADSLIGLVIQRAENQSDTITLARAYNLRGLVAFTQGWHDGALLHQLQSLYLSRRSGSTRCEADAMRQIGVLLWYRGELDSALYGFYHPALELYRAIGDRLGEATTISNIGHIHGTREDWQTALHHQLTAMDIRKRAGDLKGEADSYYFLASLVPHSDHGKTFAHSYYSKSYTLAQRIGYTWGAEIAYRGLQYLDFESTAIPERVHAREDSLFESSTEARLGYMERTAYACLLLGRWDEAIEKYNRIVYLRDSIRYYTGQEAVLLFSAEALAHAGRFEEAERHALRALHYTRAIGRTQGVTESELTLAFIYLKADSTARAVAMLQVLTQRYDSLYVSTLRTTTPVVAFETAAGQAHRTRGRAYGLLVQALAAQQRCERLFEVLERERLLPFWGGRDGGGKRETMSTLIQLIENHTTTNDDNTEWRSLQTKVGEVYQAMVLDRNAMMASSREVDVAEPARLQELRDILTPKQVFVSSHVSEDNVVLLAVRKGRCKILQRAIRRKELQSVTDILRTTLLRGKDRPADDLWKGPAAFLYSLFVQPLLDEGLLGTGDHLILSPHRETQLIPFNVLCSVGGSFLVDDVALSYTVSATHLVRSSREVSVRPRSLLTFAPDDEGLPFVQKELNAIPEDLFSTTVSFSNNSATVGQFLLRSQSADAIHIAAHGRMNLLHPLYSTITCADRTLELHEILQMKLRARYILLSACETGLAAGAAGKIPGGHDLVSFPRAFITAGAASVISPLWIVEDRSVALFVSLFYEELRKQVATDSPLPSLWEESGVLATALNRAQRRFKSDHSSSHPFYWAAFTLTGKP